MIVHIDTRRQHRDDDDAGAFVGIVSLDTFDSLCEVIITFEDTIGWGDSFFVSASWEIENSDKIEELKETNPEYFFIRRKK